MKIGLVCLSNEHGDVLPLGLISIASYFKQRFLHHQIEIVDINFENPINKIFYSHYDLIGISSMTVQYEKATALARKVKDKSNIPIIIGGAHISTLPFSLRDCFDIGVIGEGEETFCNIVDLYEKKGKLFLSDLRDIGGVVYREDGKLNITQNMASIDPLDLVPSLDYSIIDHKYFRFKAVTYWAEFGREAILSTSRGCPYKCIFCSSTQFWGKVRYFSARRVMEEIKNLVKKYNVDHIWISDDLFTINKNRLKEIAEEFQREDLHKRVKLGCMTRANLVDDELCNILKSINIKTVFFGFESGNQRILSLLKCDSATIEQNKKAIETCIKHGLRVVGSVIFSSPTETPQDMEDTIKFIDYARKAGADRIWSNVMTPLPGTEIWEIAKEKNKVNTEMNFELLDFQASDNPLLLDESINKKYFKRIYLKGRRHLYYFKWRKLFSMLKNKPFYTILLALFYPWEYIKKALIPWEE